MLKALFSTPYGLRSFVAPDALILASARSPKTGAHVGVRRHMMAMAKTVAARMRRDGRSGSAAIEFAVVAPALFLLLFGIIETGVLFFASSTLQNATDDTARMIRTGQFSGTISASDLKTRICSELNPLISNSQCMANLELDLRSFTSFSGTSYGTVTKPDGTVDPTKLKIEGVGACTVVLMRSFYPWTIMTPLMEPLLENMPNGQRLLTAAAAFRTEPYLSGVSC